MEPGTFLSTPSVRRATSAHFSVMLYGPISIHALREEGDDKLYAISTYGGISIHALREEGDTLFVNHPFCYF